MELEDSLSSPQVSPCKDDCKVLMVQKEELESKTTLLKSRCEELKTSDHNMEVELDDAWEKLKLRKRNMQAAKDELKSAKDAEKRAAEAFRHLQLRENELSEELQAEIDQSRKAKVAKLSRVFDDFAGIKTQHGQKLQYLKTYLAKVQNDLLLPPSPSNPGSGRSSTSAKRPAVELSDKSQKPRHKRKRDSSDQESQN